MGASRGGVALRDVGICVVICPVFLCPCAAVCPPLLASSGIPLHHGKCQSARPRPSVFSIFWPLPFGCESCIYVWCRRPKHATTCHANGATAFSLFVHSFVCIRFILYVYVTSICLSWMFSCGCDKLLHVSPKYRGYPRRDTRSECHLPQPQKIFFFYIFCLVYCAYVYSSNIVVYLKLNCVKT